MSVRDTGGLFAVAGHVDAARVAVLGLHGMQHRGNEGAALSVADGVRLRTVSGEGAVGDVLAESVGSLLGTVAVGTVWNGEGADRLVGGRFAAGRLVAGVVGRFTNGHSLRQGLLEDGAMLRSGSDAELLVHLVARSTQRTLVNRLVDAVWRLEGAYVLTVCTAERLVVLRDPAGFRPVWLGHLGDAVVASTDDAALVEAGARPDRPLAPGEMLIVDDRGAVGIKPLPEQPQARCTQEMLGLASAHGRPFGISSHQLRRELGAALGEKHPAPDATVVVGTPSRSSGGVPSASSTTASTTTAGPACGCWRRPCGASGCCSSPRGSVVEPCCARPSRGCRPLAPRPSTSGARRPRCGSPAPTAWRCPAPRPWRAPATRTRATWAAGSAPRPSPG